MEKAKPSYVLLQKHLKFDKAENKGVAKEVSKGKQKRERIEIPISDRVEFNIQSTQQDIL